MIIWDTVRRESAQYNSDNLDTGELLPRETVRRQRIAHARALAAVNARHERESRAREHRHQRQQKALIGLACALATVAAVLWEAGWLDGRGNVVDRQPMGEARTVRQQEAGR